MENYKSINNIVNDIFEDATFTEEVKNEIKETRFVHGLVKLRIKSGKTQKDIAKAWKCSTSKISRFEEKKDADIKLGELVKYCTAIDSELKIHIASPIHSHAAALKDSVTQIDNHLKELTKLAKEYNDDNIIVNGIIKFQAEVLLDIMKKASLHTDDIIERIELVKPANKPVEVASEPELVEA